uniref:Uncharacterized protein n=1 Tax=viral metagenome TaxID=1070528 RepID=A0A6C0B9P9_9ZZZZ
MKNTIIICLIFLLIVIIICSFVFPLPAKTMLENFSSYTLEEKANYPISEDKPLVYESYPYTGKKTVSNNSASDVWWHFPIFKEGSYAQITNNLKYQRNPDNGICVGSEFCGALYKDNQQGSNYTYSLPPVQNGPGTRVGYFRTPQNLFLGPQPGPKDELPTF